MSWLSLIEILVAIASRKYSMLCMLRCNYLHDMGLICLSIYFLGMILMKNWMIAILPTLSMCTMAVAQGTTGIKVGGGSMVTDTSGGISEF